MTLKNNFGSSNDALRSRFSNDSKFAGLYLMSRDSNDRFFKTVDPGLRELSDDSVMI